MTAVSATPHSLACVLPPFLLERIAANGTDDQRRRALQILAVDTSLRATRQQNSLLRGSRSAGRSSLVSAVPADVPQRSVHDAQNRETLPGVPRRQEGEPPTGDPAVDEAYDGLGATWTFYAEVYDRNSIDDEGLPLLATVHYGEDYDNAFWDGSRMVFGDGDGQLFERFTRSLDVIGHELTHGVVEDEASLIYLEQSGALNESICDVFGSLVKQHALKQSAEEADWLIAADLLGPDVQGSALRSMKEPGTAYDDDVLGKDPQPAHLRDYVVTVKDNGGVHINSGIPNHAFYLAATSIGGYAWERAGRIWYDALRDSQIRPTTRFTAFARATVRAAGQSFPDEVPAVRDAWSAVGIEV
ncbi:MAG: M4 family metallopeptidase [Actinomycetota bacterium]|nr:M4 family metallopeptidase [Actinomycetota bacterium]